MRATLKVIGALVMYACVATVISQTVGISYLWSIGKLNRDMVKQMVSIAQGAEMIPADSVSAAAVGSGSPQYSPLEDLMQRRVSRSLDLTLREQALAKGLGDLRGLQTKLEWSTKTFDTRKDEFKIELDRLESKAKNDAIVEVRRTLEAMEPQLAKEQLVQMMADGEDEAVVAMIKAMAIDKRNDILAEFDNRAGGGRGDKENLTKILRQILSGQPQTNVIKDTRKQMQIPDNQSAQQP